MSACMAVAAVRTNQDKAAKGRQTEMQGEKQGCMEGGRDAGREAGMQGASWRQLVDLKARQWRGVAGSVEPSKWLPAGAGRRGGRERSTQCAV